MSSSGAPDPKSHLHEYLRLARETMLWKLDGLSEYDARRPLTPTATNLLGLVRHLTGVEAGYLGLVFGRPFDGALPADDPEGDPHVDLWVPAEQSRSGVVAGYRRVWAHADATVAALPLDATGRVPHWPPERAAVSLHRVLVHVIAETHRHAGHADILREALDGAVGHRVEVDNMADESDWARHRARVEAAARTAREAGG